MILENFTTVFGYILCIILLLYVIIRMGFNYFKGKDDLW
jgi:hypothetical protein